MRLYRSNAASDVRLNFGVELAAGLSFFDKTKGHAASLEAVQGPLAEAGDATRQARKPLPRLRAARRFAEYGLEQTLRRVQLACRELDGGRVGPATQAVFPDGLEPEVTPKGAAQVKAAKKLRERLEHGGLAELQAKKAELLGLLDPAIAAFEAAQAALTSADELVARARAAELGRRDDHRRTVDAIFGHVRAAYPGDRAIQGVIAPVVESASGNGAASSDDDGADDGDSPGSND